jgi:hypothetical protein
LIDSNVNCVGFGFEVLKGNSYILSPPDCARSDFKTEPSSLGLGLAHLEHGLGVVSIKHNCQPAQLGHNFTQEF